ncbi:MAG TPA: (2Fe-2S) ferredoxin domain-containing protein [Anaerolineales bacterium]|nr:(2Fe-2S) ferredoxin domain-containing protein [Anaerolineales bacterium]
MSTIKSLDDLKRLRDEALAKKRIKTESGETQITVAMGTCGIAAGARDTMKAILDQIEERELSGVLVTQTGCLGLCEYEPLVQITTKDTPQITYGRVTPEIAARLVQEHVVGGQVVPDYVVQA